LDFDKLQQSRSSRSRIWLLDPGLAFKATARSNAVAVAVERQDRAVASIHLAAAHIDARISAQTQNKTGDRSK
jgi:hypothetical protein